MKKVKVLVHRKDEQMFLEILSQMIERRVMAVNPLRVRRDGRSMIELSA